MTTTTHSGDRRRARSRARFRNWLAWSFTFAFGSCAVASYAGYLLYVRATAEFFGDNSAMLVLILYLFVSWGLSAFWGVLLVRAFRRFGRRGLWFLAPAPLIIFGPVLMSLSLMH